jgi:glucose/arabinose dehydrogenase
MKSKARCFMKDKTRPLAILLLAAWALSSCGRLPEASAPLPGGQPAEAQAVGSPVETAPLEFIQLPEGFTISVFAQELDKPRMLALGPDGAVYVAERGAGQITRLVDADGDGRAETRQVVAGGLEAPTSLAFHPDGWLYVGETTRILRLSQPDSQGVYQERQVIIDGLPSGGHVTRTVAVSPDGAKLYVSIGSSCNVCLESDPRRAAIWQYNPDGSGGRLFAKGLRNAVGLAFAPGSGELWTTNNGRDLLGDDLPPDTIQAVFQGQDFGWPRCHAGVIPDPEFGAAGSCKEVSPPAVKLQAHSAPLGLAFYSAGQFPSRYQGGLFVALHGSWNRSVPTGYKVIWIPFRDGVPGQAEDFASGWLQGKTAWGRPVDVLQSAAGSLLISDDAGGIIYMISYTGQEK